MSQCPGSPLVDEHEVLSFLTFYSSWTEKIYDNLSHLKQKCSEVTVKEMWLCKSFIIQNGCVSQACSKELNHRNTIEIMLLLFKHYGAMGIK